MRIKKISFDTITKLQWIIRVLSYAMVIGFIIVIFPREIAWASVFKPLFVVTLIPVMVAWGYPLLGSALIALYASLLFAISLIRINVVSPKLPFYTVESLFILILLICGLMYLYIGYLKHKRGML